MNEPTPPKLKIPDWLLIGAMGAVVVYFYGFLNVFGKVHDQSAINWWSTALNDENGYSHAWFMLPLAIFIIWRMRQELGVIPLQPRSTGLIWVAVGLGLFLLGVRATQPRFCLMALPPLIYGGVLFVWGKMAARRLLFPLSTFLFAIPIPWIQATNFLQVQVTAAAHHMGNLCGIKSTLAGNILHLPNTSLTVDQGCSGIRSLVALSLIAYVYSYYAHKELWKRVVVFLSSLPIAIVANIFRIFSILVVSQVNPQFASGVYHDNSGFVTFAVGLLLLLLTSKFLNEGAKMFKGRAVVRRVVETPPERIEPSTTAVAERPS